MFYMSIFEVSNVILEECELVSPNYKTIRIFLSGDLIMFLTKKVKREGEREFWYLLKRIFLTKFEQIFLNLMNIKELFSPEISNITSCNILLNCCYKVLKSLMRKRNITILPPYYLENEKVSSFYSSLFEYGEISLINKPTRISATNRPKTDQKICYYNWQCLHQKYFRWVLRKGVIKSNLSDHLPIFFSVTTSKLPQNSSPFKHKKRIFNKNNLASFKDQISNINWDNLNRTQYSTKILKISKYLRKFFKYF